MSRPVTPQSSHLKTFSMSPHHQPPTCKHLLASKTSPVSIFAHICRLHSRTPPFCCSRGLLYQNCFTLFQLILTLPPPLQVACYIRIGATTGAIDRTNYLCILSNNLFNQKYFLILWVWWIFLLVVAILGLIYRVARILVPDFSRFVHMLSLFKVIFWKPGGCC